MAGVPKDEITAHDFVMVRAALVQRLGSANNALVWTRIHFRCADGAHRHTDAEGVTWWRASNEQIGEEVGLTPDQVYKATTALRKAGFVESAEHRLGGNYDRTQSWRAVVEGDGLDVVDRRNGDRQSTDMTSSIDDQDVVDRRNVPSSQTQKTEEDKNTVVDVFDMAWTCWPRKAGKKAARAKFERLVRDGASMEDLALAIQEHGAAYGKWVQPQYVPHLTTWLNGERWEDDLPGPRGGRGQERQDEGLALIARLREQEEVGHAGIGGGAAAALGSGR